jgi:hypothetical protein
MVSVLIDMTEDAVEGQTRSPCGINVGSDSTWAATPCNGQQIFSASGKNLGSIADRLPLFFDSCDILSVQSVLHRLEAA